MKTLLTLLIAVFLVGCKDIDSTQYLTVTPSCDVIYRKGGNDHVTGIENLVSIGLTAYMNGVPSQGHWVEARVITQDKKMIKITYHEQDGFAQDVVNNSRNCKLHSTTKEAK